jgi:hypothetical protein
MALESTQHLTEMGTRNRPWGGLRPVCKADNLTAICDLTLENVAASTSHNSMGLQSLLQGEFYLSLKTSASDLHIMFGYFKCMVWSPFLIMSLDYISKFCKQYIIAYNILIMLQTESLKLTSILWHFCF